MARRRSGNSHTTISVTWNDKDELRRYALCVKETKNGNMFESDAVLFSRMLKFFVENSDDIPKDKSKPTYPNKISLDKSQQDSSLEEPNVK